MDVGDRATQLIVALSLGSLGLTAGLGQDPLASQRPLGL